MASAPSTATTEHVENGSATAPGPDPETRHHRMQTKPPQSEAEPASTDSNTAATDAATDAQQMKQPRTILQKQK